MWQAQLQEGTNKQTSAYSTGLLFVVDLYYLSRAPQPRDAGWLMNGSMSSNSSYTSTYTSKLANNATLTYQFSTFDDLLILTLGMHSPLPLLFLLDITTDERDPTLSPSLFVGVPANNYTFSITPAFIKFSLRLDRWNWSSRYSLFTQWCCVIPTATAIRNNLTIPRFPLLSVTTSCNSKWPSIRHLPPAR